jgi:hypothetical protein
MKKMLMVLIMMGAASGCASTPVETMVPHFSRVKFSRPLQVPLNFQVTEDSDRKQMISAAIHAFDKGQWVVAAGYFERAARSVQESERNEWAIGCWGSAAISYLNAGDREAFLLSAGEMDRNLSYHQRVNSSQQVALVLGIKARMQKNLKTIPAALPPRVLKILRSK